MPHVAHHADNPGRAPMGDGDDLPHGIAVREIGMCQNAVDDNHGLGLGGVRRGEKTASKQRNFHCLKVLRTRLEIERMRGVLDGGGLLRADPEGATVVLLTQGNNIGKICGLYAGKMANAF